MSAFRQMAEATPERASALLMSAVERLLVDALVLPAVFLWGEHRSSEERESRVGARLDAVLVEGWQTTRLWAEGLPAVDLATPAAMKLAADGAEWMCLAGGRSHRGRTRAAAVRAAAVSLIFDALATRWRKETGGLSVVRVRYEHPAMKEILSMGQEVVPEILRRLEHQPDHWHAALAQLTGETPIASGERITASQACRRWVAWGRQRGLAG